MSIVFATNVSRASAGTSGTIDTTGCTLLVIAVAYFSGGAAPSPSDSKSNTWLPLTIRSSGSTARVQLFYCKNPTVGSGHTFTESGISFGGFCVQGFSGTDTSADFDQENGAGTTGATTLATGSITPSQDDCLVVAAVCAGTPLTDTYSIDSGFTETDETSSATNFECVMAYKIQTTAAAVNPTWTRGTTGQMAAAIASFKATAAASGGGMIVGPGPLVGGGMLVGGGPIVHAA